MLPKHCISWIVIFFFIAPILGLSDEPSPPATETKPVQSASPRLSDEEKQAKLKERDRVLVAADERGKAGQFAEGRVFVDKAAAIDREVLDEIDWHTTDARIALERAEGRTKLSAEDRQALDESKQLDDQIEALYRGGKYADGIPLAQKELAITEKVLGKDHPDTVSSLNNLALLYQAQGNNAAALPLFQRALAINERVLGKDHPDTATSLNNLALLYQAQADYAAALPLYQRALAIREKVLGKEHPHTAVSLNNLALLYRDQGNYAAALPLLQRAVAIYETALGKDHPDTASSLNNLAMLYQAQGDFVAALPLYQRALAIREKVLGMHHPLTALSLNNLASLNQAQGNNAAALPLFQRAVAIYETALGKDHPDTASSLNNLAMLYHAQGDFAAALPIFQRALAIREKVLGKVHPHTAVSLNNLAMLYQDQGDYAAALPLLQRSLAINETALGKNHPGTALSLNNLARLYCYQGDYAAALPLYQKSLAIREQTLGKVHPYTGTSLNNLASLYQSQGDYAAALPLFQRALAINERILGKDHPDTALSMNNLALLYEVQGDYAAALPLYQEALSIREKALGKDHPYTASSLNNLALLYQDQGNYAAALPLFQRAVAIYEKALGKDHPDTAFSINNLALLYCFQGDYAAALPLDQQALVIREKALGKDHPYTASSLNNLAMLYQAQGDYVAPMPLLQRSLAINEKVLGKDHPDTALSLSNLALLYEAQGDYAAALPFYRQALATMRRSVELSSAVQSERQQIAMTGVARRYLDSYLRTLLVTGGKGETAYAPVLEWKGMVTARQRMMRLARSTKDPEVAGILADLQSTTTRLATLAFAVPTDKQRTAWQRQITELSRRKEELEGELSQRSAAFRSQQAEAKTTPGQVQAALPADAALIDLLVYSDYEIEKSEKGPHKKLDRHVMAFVVRRDKPIEWLDLGSVDLMVEAIEAWRKDFGASGSGQAGEPSVKLRQLTWDKLEQHVGDAKTVLISPSGELARFPWAALPGKQPGKYLLEERAIAVIPVAQQLPALLAQRPTEAVEPSLLLVGDVDYGALPGTALLASAFHSASRPVRAGELAKWQPLSGSRPEIAAINDYFARSFHNGKVDTLDGLKPTEEAVRQQAGQHRYVHLATHGFFTPPEVKSALDDSARDNRRREFDSFSLRDVSGFHPGLLSGVVLAGANRPPAPDQDDGILTALEVAELDLSHVELVTLSACETGLGKSAGGEGLLGLQRAFQVAGARNVVASLWKVDDAATQALMTEFYKNLWQKKLPPLESLRQAQLTMIAHYEPTSGKLRAGFDAKPINEKVLAEARRNLKSGEHLLPPFYWAAFVLSGPGD